MKKILVLLICLIMMLPVSGCRQKMTDIDRLVIGFTPKTSGTEIQEFSRELQNIIREQIYDLGFNIGNVEIVFTTSNRDLIDQIEKGSIDLGLVSPMGYLDNKESHVKPLAVTLTLDNILESTDLSYVNDRGKEIRADKAPGYYSFIYVNIASQTGRDLYDKALNDNMKWDDVKDLRWCVGSPASLDTYMYPSLWLNRKFGKGFGNSRRTVRELNNVESHLGYFDMMSRLINQECDVMCRYADMRKEIRFDEVIFSRYGSQYDDMYDLIRVIGVTPLIYNDIVVFNNKSVSAPYQKALLMVLQAIGEPDDSILRRINIYGFQEINEKDLKDMQDMLNLFDK